MCNEKQDWDIYGDQFENLEESWFKTVEMAEETKVLAKKVEREVCKNCPHPLDCSRCWR